MGTTRLKSRRRKDQGLKWARVTIAILSTIGLIDTGSITMSRWGWIGSLACPGSSDGCEKVLNSAWGTIFEGNGFSIPLSLMGLSSYLIVLVMAILPLLPGLSENKTDLSKRTWWGLFITTCGMAIFSLFLIGLMIFKIQAFCLFCIVSAIISTTLLILTLIGGSWDEPGELIFRGVLLSLGVLLAGFIWSSGINPNQEGLNANTNGVPPIVKNKSTLEQLTLAKHLKAKGAIMYSAFWCPHCHDQKEMFGKEASKELIIIECAQDGINNQYALCKEKGINAFPSWVINGKLESGVQSLAELSIKSQYKGPAKNL